jgi:adenylate kinase family enzyme
VTKPFHTYEQQIEKLKTEKHLFVEDNVYFINGNAYAGKSTMVKRLAAKHDGIACEENYQNYMIESLSSDEFPNLTYTRDLKNWSDFVRRTPEEYEAWIDGCTEECAVLELEILEELSKQDKKIFVDTNIPVDVLKRITNPEHIVIMLANPDISVNRFFERPDKEKQFIYQLLLKEENPDKAIQNYKECLKRVNSMEKYNEFLNSGCSVILRDDNRTVEETVSLVEKVFHI